jgi:hypothetical protein
VFVIECRVYLYFILRSKVIGVMLYLSNVGKKLKQEVQHYVLRPATY